MNSRKSSTICKAIIAFFSQDFSTRYGRLSLKCLRKSINVNENRQPAKLYYSTAIVTTVKFELNAGKGMPDLPPAARKLSHCSPYTSNGISLNLSRRTNRVCPTLCLKVGNFTALRLSARRTQNIDYPE